MTDGLNSESFMTDGLMTESATTESSLTSPQINRSEYQPNCPVTSPPVISTQFRLSFLI